MSLPAPQALRLATTIAPEVKSRISSNIDDSFSRAIRSLQSAASAMDSSATAGQPAAPARKLALADPGATIESALAYTKALSAKASKTESQGIDYSPFIGMTPIEVYGAHPEGLPPDWDWSAWSEAAGKSDPTKTDVTGAALGANGFRIDTPAANLETSDLSTAPLGAATSGHWVSREGADGSVHTFSVAPPSGWSGLVEFASAQMPSSLGEVSGVKLHVSDATGHSVYDSTDASNPTGLLNPAGIDVRFAASGASGPYTITATYVGAGQQSFCGLCTP
jgi:hypothetical protein